MEGLKLYFFLIDENETPTVSVHREFKTIEVLWNLNSSQRKTGVIHAGYSRPNLNKKTFTKYPGTIVVTATLKWILPAKYKITDHYQGTIVISGYEVPYYLITEGFGYESNPVEQLKATSIDSTHTGINILDDILNVLKTSKKPITSDEVFAELVRSASLDNTSPETLRYIEAKLDELLSQNDIASLEADHRKYYFSGSSQFEFHGWVNKLLNEEGKWENILIKNGISDETSYLNNIQNIQGLDNDQIGLFRFKQLLNETDNSNPLAIIDIAPESILDKNINNMKLSVRVTNVLKEKNIFTLRPLKKHSLTDLLGWKNFGKKSVKDMAKCIINEIDKLNRFVSGVDKKKQNKDDEEYKEQLLTSITLKDHFDTFLKSLNEAEKTVIESRLGVFGKISTLEECGNMLGVTRERVRQIQEKCLKNLFEKNKWVGIIGLKIDSLISVAESPLILETLEVEDEWFKGFNENIGLLGQLVQTLTKKEFKELRVAGQNIISRINKNQWSNCIKEFKGTFSHNTVSQKLSKIEVKLIIKSKLSAINASELSSLAWNILEKDLNFHGESDEALLVSFGRSAESSILAVLNSAEKPLHYTEVAKRATKILGKHVEERRAQGSCQSNAMLFGRGTYGLEKFIKVQPETQIKLIEYVEELLYQGPLKKQWHTSEIMECLEKDDNNLADELDLYLANIILKKSSKLSYLNRMVWARSDSGQTGNDRIDQADAFTKILKDNDGPLKGVELKRILKDIRGVATNLQIQPTEEMIQIGPDYWGLIDRDINASQTCINKCLNFLEKYLKIKNKGIHVSEAQAVFDKYRINTERISCYAIFNLAQRDDRFYLGRSMFLGLSKWGDDTRRLNFAQALREISNSAKSPMKLSDIHSRVESLTGLPLEGTVTGMLINMGAKYDEDNKLWEFEQN